MGIEGVVEQMDGTDGSRVAGLRPQIYSRARGLAMKHSLPWYDAFYHGALLNLAANAFYLLHNAGD